MNSASLPIRIRPLSPADLERILEIAARLPQAPQWPPSAYLAALDTDATLRRFALVAEDADTGTIIGFVVASLVQNEAELETIAVAPEFQRRGVARMLFREMASAFRLAGMTGINLEVRGSNQAALALYRSLAFSQSGSRPRYYSEPIEDAILLSLRLVSS